MTSISAGGFQNCTSLTEITLPESVTKLDIMAFRDCASLKTINLTISLNMAPGFPDV